MSDLGKQERQLRDYYTLIEVLGERKAEKGNLEFSAHLISEGDVAERCFCEKKVEP